MHLILCIALEVLRGQGSDSIGKPAGLGVEPEPFASSACRTSFLPLIFDLRFGLREYYVLGVGNLVGRTRPIYEWRRTSTDMQ